MGIAVAFFTGMCFAALFQGHLEMALGWLAIATFLTSIHILNEKDSKK